MKITVVGRGNVGGGLANRWEAAGHEVQALGRDGGDGADADVVVVAVPSASIADALGTVSGIEGKLEDQIDFAMALSQAGLGQHLYRYWS